MVVGINDGTTNNLRQYRTESFLMIKPRNHRDSDTLKAGVEATKPQKTSNSSYSYSAQDYIDEHICLEFRP